MFKKSIDLNLQDIKILGAAILPFASLAFTKIISPIFESAAMNAPGMNTQLAVPTSAQGTGYFVNYPDQYRR